MAKQLKEFPFRSLNGNGARYKWDKFCDGNIWQLQRVKDFPKASAIGSVAVGIRMAAKRLGYSLRTSTSKDLSTLTIQAYKPKKVKS